MAGDVAPLAPVGAPGTDVQPAPRPAPEARTPAAEIEDRASRQEPSPETAPTAKARGGELPPDPKKAAERIRQKLREIHEKGYLRELRMDVEIEDDLGLVMVKIIDARTDKVIRTVPPKEQVEFARKMEAFLGLLFDQKA